MNEQAVRQVITDYAIEVANLKVSVATLQAELAEVKEQLKEREGEK